jgi:hypothetical protein
MSISVSSASTVTNGSDTINSIPAGVVIVISMLSYVDYAE